MVEQHIVECAMRAVVGKTHTRMSGRDCSHTSRRMQSAAQNNNVFARGSAVLALSLSREIPWR